MVSWALVMASVAHPDQSISRTLRWEAQVGLIKMTLEEKELDLVQACARKQSRRETSQQQGTTSGQSTSQTGPFEAIMKSQNELDVLYRPSPANNMARWHHPWYWNKASVRCHQILHIKKQHVKKVWLRPTKCWRQQRLLWLWRIRKAWVICLQAFLDF